MLDTEYVDPKRVQLFICLPSRETIGVLHEAYQVKRNVKLGNVSELSFRIPYKVDRSHKFVPNPNIDKTKNRFLVRFEYGDITEWYVIITPTDTMEDNGADYKTIECFSLAYQLADKNIRNYTATSINATAALTVALSETNWTIGTIDANFDLMYRSFNVPNSRVLDFVFEIATTFNALVTFNTIDQQVNFSVLESYGVYKGLTISYGQLMKNATQIENSDEFYTRLKIFGAKGISINDQNITATNYLEDYSYFINGYQEDINGVVIGHSIMGMSDSLCKALITYSAKIASSNTTYQGYLTNLSAFQAYKTLQENIRDGYKNDLALIEDQIATANYNGTSTTTLVTQKNAKNAQITSQNNTIGTAQGNINTVNANITALQVTLSISSNFTTAQVKEWNPYIIVGTFENTNVSDSKQLMALGIAEFDKLKQPKLVVTLGMVNFLEVGSEYKRWNMFPDVGDTIRITNTNIGIDITAKMVEMSFDYENFDLSVVISNVKELLSDRERFLRDLYRANMTSSNVTSNLGNWNDAVTGTDSISQIINSTWDATQRSIVASVDNSVDISRKGIIVTDPTDPLKMLIIQKGLLAISGDGGNNWKSAILPDRIVAERILGKIILGNNMIIGDNNGTFNIVGNLLTIKDTTNVIRLMLGEYTSGKFGLKLMNKTGTATILDEDGIIQTDTIQLSDNVDSTHGLKLKFYVDSSVISIKQVKLNFSLEAFRAYSTGTAGGGGASVTSSSGGGAFVSSSSGGGTTVSSSSGGGATNYYNQAGSVNYGVTLDPAKNFTQYAGGHNHGIGSSVALALSGGGAVTWVWANDHLHGMYDFYLTIQNHSHTVSTPDHSHTVSTPNHAHTVDVPSHTHPIQYGIFESSSATGINIKVDGIVRDSSGYTSDRNIDLTTWITTSGWHTVELTSTQLGRINASLFIKSFVGM